MVPEPSYGNGTPSAAEQAVVAFMDVDAIRCQFVQENLRRAMTERDAERRAEFLRAFRAYFEWFGSRFSEREKLGVLSQLANLEALEGPRIG